MPPPSRAVFARHAASLIVHRPGADGTEVLMGERNAGSRFMPSRLVFPGGAVDPADADAPAATEPDPVVLAHLQRHGRPRLARAVLVAAARELQEETGLSLGTPPRLHVMEYLCRAVTPPTMHMRFNARFLLVAADAVEGTLRSSDELERVRFIAVSEALQVNLMDVTREVLGLLQPYLQLSDGERRARIRTPAFKQRRWREE